MILFLWWRCYCELLYIIIHRPYAYRGHLRGIGSNCKTEAEQKHTSVVLKFSAARHLINTTYHPQNEYFLLSRLTTSCPTPGGHLLSLSPVHILTCFRRREVDLSCKGVDLKVFFRGRCYEISTFSIKFSIRFANSAYLRRWTTLPSYEKRNVHNFKSSVILKARFTRYCHLSVLFEVIFSSFSELCLFTAVCKRKRSSPTPSRSSILEYHLRLRSESDPLGPVRNALRNPAVVVC